ncbi:MAG: NAD(P)H-dependent oxidoreductase [Bacteroidia bacterium]
MKNIIAFGASTSGNSINKQLAAYAAKQTGLQFKMLDLNDFELPLYSIDKENDTGFPQKLVEFHQLIKEADGIIISFAEHNGAVTAAYKNLHDWISRLERTAWAYKNMLLLSTSPGQGAAQSALAYAQKSFGISKAIIGGNYSLPSFYQNFDVTDGIKNPELKAAFQEQIDSFVQHIHSKDEVPI